MDVLDRRSLGRATLARQLLLERRPRDPYDVIGRLVGLQGQDPDPPYIGLWTRITDFEVDALARLLLDRRVVRATTLRGTQHLLTADDYLWIRPLLQPVLDRVRKGGFGTATAGIDPSALAEAARELLEADTLTRSELGAALAERWPGHDQIALARSTQYLLPVVHPPPDGLWRRHGPTPFTLAEHWLGRPLAEHPSLGDLALRYLAAFGPATVRDLQAWSGLTGLRAVVDSLHPHLRVFRSESGQVLFDLPDAPRPGPDVPAPVRFLAPLDNVVLAYADRSRFMTDEQRRYVGFEAVLMVDGFVRGLWSVRRQADRADLTVKLFDPLGADEPAVREEGEALLRFVAPEVDEHRLEFVPVET